MLFFSPRENVSYNVVLKPSSIALIFSDEILISYNGGLNVCQLFMDKYSGIASSVRMLACL
jgi:hypothetical protein